MRQRTDVFGALAWGLRVYAWVVAVFVVLFGVAVPALLQQVPEQYEASAQIGPTQRVRVSNVDVLPKVAATVFANVYDSPEVKRAAELRPSGSLDVADLELVAGQDNLVFSVVGRAQDPTTARRLADTAGAVFVDELNKYAEAIGPYALTTLAVEPREPVAQTSGMTRWAAGLAAGLVTGCGVVALILVLRRPVIDAATIEEVTGVPVLARVSLADARAPSGVTQLARRLHAEHVEALLLVGPKQTREDRRLLREHLGRWLAPVRRAVPLAASSVDDTRSVALADQVGSETPDDDVVAIVEDPTPVQLATRPERSLTLLVVPEGISEPSLREAAADLLGGDDSGVLLLARSSQRSAGSARHRDPSSTRSGTVNGRTPADARGSRGDEGGPASRRSFGRRIPAARGQRERPSSPPRSAGGDELPRER